MQDPAKLTATEAARLIRDGRLTSGRSDGGVSRANRRAGAGGAGVRLVRRGCRAAGSGGGAAGDAAWVADRREGRARYCRHAERIRLADLAWLAAAGGCGRGRLGARGGRRGDRQDRHHGVRHAQAWSDRQPAQSASIRRVVRAAGRRRAWRTGFFPLAYGTQTAGSVIRPAAFCGVVGYKPSYGMINRLRHEADVGEP